jgi:hypothetical protein
VSKFGASDVVGVEEDKEELAPQSPRSAAGILEASAGALATPWPPSWVSAADNDNEDDEVELAPQTPPTTKSFNVHVALVDKVVGKEAECVAGEHDGWQEVM